MAAAAVVGARVVAERAPPPARRACVYPAPLRPLLRPHHPRAAAAPPPQQPPPLLPSGRPKPRPPAAPRARRPPRTAARRGVASARTCSFEGRTRRSRRRAPPPGWRRRGRGQSTSLWRAPPPGQARRRGPAFAPRGARREGCSRGRRLREARGALRGGVRAGRARLRAALAREFRRGGSAGGGRAKGARRRQRAVHNRYGAFVEIDMPAAVCGRGLRLAAFSCNEGREPAGWALRALPRPGASARPAEAHHVCAPELQRTAWPELASFWSKLLAWFAWQRRDTLCVGEASHDSREAVVIGWGDESQRGAPTRRSAP